MITFWLYLCGEPYHCVRLPANASDNEIRQKAISEAYIVCNYPDEGPLDRIHKIAFCEIRN